MENSIISQSKPTYSKSLHQSNFPVHFLYSGEPMIKSQRHNHLNIVHTEKKLFLTKP
jgi:hypothetical protein